jgi:hypothetical protein
MKNLKLLLSVGLLSLLFNSCTITKRHYRSGYHIEWKKRKQAATLSREESSADSIKSKTIIAKSRFSNEEVSSDQTPETKTVENKELPSIQPQIKTIEDKPIAISDEQKVPIQQIEIDDEEVENSTSKPRMHPLTWAIWAMWIGAIICMFCVTFYAEALIGIVIGFTFAMIFSFTILAAFKKHPEKYRLKNLSYGFMVPSFIFGSIVLTGLIVFLLLMMNPVF